MGSTSCFRGAIRLLLLALALAACRQPPPPPTPAPTRAIATPRPTATPPPAGPEAAEPGAIDWPPQVVTSSPQPGEEAALDGAITIRFDQPMDQASVEAAFAVRAAAGPDEAVDGRFTWPREDTVIFTPAAKLARQQRYRVQIDAAARGRNGHALDTPITLDVETVGFLAASQVIPAPDTTDVQIDSAITVLFNRPVVPLTAPSRAADLPQPLTFAPPVAGAGQWVSTSIYRFVPDGPLAGGATVQVTVEAGLEDVAGALLEEPFTWTFTTVAPAVVSLDPTKVVTIFPLESVERLSPESGFAVAFNMPMDRASAEGAVTLALADDPAGSPAADLLFTWRDDDRTLLITPTLPLALDTGYALAVTTAARAANGNAPLHAEAAAAFHTIPYPAVGSARPQDGQDDVNLFFTNIYVGFVSPMAAETVVGQVRVEPAPDPEEANEGLWDGEGRYSSSYNLTFPFEPETTYTVTVPATAADLYGNTLGEDYRFRFTTPPAPPVVSLNLPFGLSQLTTSYPTAVQVGFRSTAQVEATLHDLGLPLDLLHDPYRVTDPAFDPGEPLRSWSLPVEKTDTVAVLDLPLADGAVLPPGVYLVTVDSVETPVIPYWYGLGENARNLVIVADTNLVVKETFGRVHVWATDLATGAPAAGRRIAVYDDRGRQVGQATTDGDGLARVATTRPDRDDLPGVVVVSNAPGEAGFGVGASGWDLSVRPYEFGLPEYYISDEVPLAFYLITDRPIYRPGDTVHFRGILREQQYGRYAVGRLAAVDLRLTSISPYYVTEDQDLDLRPEVDERGNFAGEFVISAAWPLGDYVLATNQAGVQGERAFTVADYRAPEFTVSVTPAAPEILRGEAVDMVVEAAYFFGGPATDLRVYWSVTAERFFLPWEGSPYSFQDEFGGVHHLISGDGVTDGDGRLTVTLPPNLLDNLRQGSWTVNLEVTVWDVSEFGVSARAGVLQHGGLTYVGMATADYLNPVDVAAAFNLVTVGWDREPHPERPVEVVFARREWRSERVSSFGGYATQWTPVDTEVARVQTVTDAAGEATVAFTPTVGGTYVANATVADADGRTQTSTTFLWVSDPGYTGWRSSPRERRMELAPDRDGYRVGDTARILVQSPFDGPVNAWLIIERGVVIEERLVILDDRSTTLMIPIDADDVPNVYVSVVAVQGTLGGSAFADIRLGLTELEVDPAPLALDIAITPDRSRVQPGETVTYTLRVTDAVGNPAQADVTLALVDLAVLSLKPDNAPPILEAFYADQPYRSRLGSGLFHSGEGLELEFPEPLLGGGGGGNGAGATASVALEEDDVRRDFRDTAYWAAVVTTDEEGVAVVSVALPDNLTTWRMSAKAATVETLVGQAFVDIISSKPVLIRPVTPRFMMVGDEIQLGAIVNNNSGAAQTVTVRLDATGVTLQGDAAQEIALPAAGSRLVRWPVVVEDAEAADLTFRVSNTQYQDASKPTFGVGPEQLIPIARYTGEEIVGTAGVVTGPGRRVEGVLLPPGLDTRQGAVTVALQASLAAALLDALAYQEAYDFPPDCPYAFADRLLSTSSIVYALDALGAGDAALRDRLSALAVADLAALADLQLADGGWGWCFAETSDAYLTGHVFFALLLADRAGFAAAPEVRDRAAAALARQIIPAGSLTDEAAINQQAFVLYVLAEHGNGQTAAFANALVARHRDRLHPYARAHLVLVHTLTGHGGSALQRTLLADLNAMAIVSATGAHWENRGPGWNSLSSDISGTAIALSALLRTEPDNGLLPQAARWLMVARTGDHWPSTHETAWSIHALTDWMVATGELEADYAYEFAVNQVTRAEGAFDAGNVAGVVVVAIPLGALAPDEVNYLAFRQAGGAGSLYYSAFVDSHIDATTVGALSRGIVVQRAVYDAACDPERAACPPITRLPAGARARVVLTIIAENDLLYATAEDYLPAGAEAVDPGLLTSASGLGAGAGRADDRSGDWGWWWFDRVEYRDDRVVFYADFLPAGTYQYTYYLETVIPGTYRVRPAVARQAFFPDVFGRSEGTAFTITGR